MEIKIAKWKDRFAKAYIDLSIEWLEKYVSVESGDLEIIEHPYESVLNNGGMIWFALVNNTTVGTVTMIKSSDNSYELAKLAVTEKYKKLGIGERLMKVAIKFARENSTKKIYLFTNHNLIPAINLYKKYKFVEIPLIDNKYIESDMKMELNLK
ncbi:GNAT family N-acetyltransferase [uncultured Fusobacterium sp.]|uniref:GNAT family N-acetyltransferase n=1 Tax=uncultured Fusobacterium sp. TaxID=159267 RepID=UPI0025F2DA87|nr:GNAT family N-acetyltransferase [uncultured Fusobacterium sp.]